MAFSIKNAGSWVDVKGISVKDGGTWKTVQNGYIKKAGTWVEFFANATVLTITSTVNNYNVFTAAGSPTQPVNVILNINSGATIGATSGNTALTIGQFPTGSVITINNSGTIAGYGGAGGTSGVGSSGGDAIYANYANQTVVINNLTGAAIYGGGGGGGKGGSGGTGGSGGGGYYESIEWRFDGSNFWIVFPGGVQINWDGGNVYFGGNPGGAVGPWRQGGYQYSGKGSNDYYTVGRASGVYTSGGNGGSGGTGGAGGRGLGADGAAASGSSGTGGSAGSGGGTNAGAGGNGGSGGTGGTGGTWGTAGANGNNGATGNTGASGNNGGGAAGAAGAGGSSGGAAGRYLVKGSNSVTINNSGTVAGGIA